MNKLVIKIKVIIFKVFCFLYDIYGFIRSVYIYLFRPIILSSVFYGYKSYYWASKYAEKRTLKWKKGWDQMGRVQGVFAWTDETLITCSKMELKHFKKHGIINKKIKPRKYIKKAYYKTGIA